MNANIKTKPVCSRTNLENVFLIYNSLCIFCFDLSFKQLVNITMDDDSEELAASVSVFSVLLSTCIIFARNYDARDTECRPSARDQYE
jgi:hypothetical protein